ncbi:MAG: hypothetical protein R2845_05585 [Thermomicrobiales bacterium]
MVKLPDTGSGTGTSGSDWVIPAALGAAAAAVAGRKLLGERETGTRTPDFDGVLAPETRKS